MKVLALILCAIGFPAIAQNACAPHDEVLAALEQQFGETPQVRAMQGNQTMIEITVNGETGTWTVLITDGTGLTCSPASGDQFMLVPQGDPA